MNEAIPGKLQLWGRRLRRARRRCWKLLMWFVIGSAVLVSIGRMLAPYADATRPLIEGFLAGALDKPVSIERVEASWPRLSPRLHLTGLRVGKFEQPLLRVDQAQLEFKLYNLVRPGRNSFELILLGLDLAVVQDDSGRWSWQLDRGGQFAVGWERTVAAGDIVLRDSGVRVAPKGLPELNWSVPEAALDRHGDRLFVRLVARPEGSAGDLLDTRLILGMPDSRLESLSGYAESPNFALSHLAFDSTAREVWDLRTQMRWWVDWNRRDGARFHARVGLHSLAEQGIAGHMSSRFRLDGYWRDNAFAVELNAGAFGQAEDSLIDGLTYGRRGGNRALMADRIELDYLHALMRPWLGFFEAWPEHMRGTASGLALAVDGDGAPFLARGELVGLDLAFDSPAVAVGGLDISVGLDGDQLWLEPSASRAESGVERGGSLITEYRPLYSRPLEWSSIDGRIGLGQDRIEMQSLRLQHPELEVVVNGRISLADTLPFFDLVFDVPRFGSDNPRRWVPEQGMSRNSRDWLNDALLSLGSLTARTTVFGRPGQWRERIPRGAIHSVARFSELKLDYARDWPVAEDVSGSIEFAGGSMSATVDSARAIGTHLRLPRLRIEDLGRTEIELTLESVDADAGQIAALMQALPLDGARRALEQMRWSGPAGVRANLWLPLAHRRDWRLAGTLRLENATARLPGPGLAVSRLAGQVPFSRSRMGPARLEARMGQEPVELQFDSRLGPEFSARIDGQVPIHGLLPARWTDRLASLPTRLNGRSAWNFDFGHVGAGENRHFALTARSDLQGVGMDFPAPLDKPAGERWPLEFVLPLGDELWPIEFALDERFSGQLLYGGDYWQIGIGLGGTQARLPVAENFLVEGSIDRLAFGDWVGLLARELADDSDSAAPSGGASNSGRSGWLDVSIADFGVGKASLGQVELALNRNGDYWRLNALGERVQGSLRLPASVGADDDVVVDLQRLYWPADEPDEPAAPEPPPSRLDPRAMPAFNVAIDDLRWGSLALGEFRLNAHRDTEGIEIEKLSARRDGFDLSGSGEWVAQLGSGTTRMRLRLSVANLGRALREAGFDIALKGGDSVLEFDGGWPGSPMDFTPPRVSGLLELVIVDGSIPAASPGAGRLLGLVSLNSIPRRLRLDFSDVFGDGLAFDRMAGNFRIDSGVARTDDLRIDAPAAEIRVRGVTDLRQRTYDQTLLVRPGVSSALPIIGALAGGPIGAAAGAALQQIFSRPLKGVSEVRYSVTGTWDEPIIEPAGDTDKSPVAKDDSGNDG